MLCCQSGDKLTQIAELELTHPQQGVVTTPSFPKAVPHCDREILGAIQPCKRFDANQVESTIDPPGCKAIVGISEAAVNEKLTLGNAIFEASWRGGKDLLTCNEGVTGSNPVEGSSQPPSTPTFWPLPSPFR